MHIGNVDLNLLKTLAVLLEERHVSRAAARCHLSQPAMSRAMARMRTVFADDLLVRTGAGYELTPKARALQAQLADVMPRLATIVRGDDFDPANATDTMRIHCTDYITTLVGPTWFPALFEQAPALNISIEPLSTHTFEDIERGRVDLALTPVTPPPTLRWHILFQEEFVCVLAADHQITRDRLTLDDLAGYPHSRVVVLPPESMVAEEQLGRLGVRAPSGLSVPYFAAAVAALPRTSLIAVLPSRFARLHENDPAVRIARPPAQFTPFGYGMAWHPRLNTDPAHQWLRELIRQSVHTALQ
ncbi:MAG TPA: LysR family transcriptional regulator [Pseudonocardiaceae bacterium]